MKKILIALFMYLGTMAIAAAPRYYTWVNDAKDRDWDQYFTELTATGLNGIIISADSAAVARIVPIAQKHGVAVHVWMWILNNGSIAAQHPEWLDYNAKGESLRDKKAYVDYYKFINPIIPEAREAIAKQVQAIASIDGVQSVSLDYCRYVDAILPNQLWKNYGIIQDRVYPQWDYGYHPQMIAAFKAVYGYDPQKIADPTADTVWLNFRLQAVNDLVKIIKERVGRYGVKLSASPFPTPRMSRQMVYQDWGSWPLDIAFPMIYHGFYGGGDLQWIAACVRDCRAQMPATTELCFGTYVPDYGANSPFTLEQALQTAFDNGATGFSLFTFDNLSAAQRSSLTAFLSSL